MTALAAPSRPELKPLADNALKGASVFWFATAVAGQWTFVYYIASFYGASTLAGRFEAWRKNDSLIKGYVAGDHVGNLYFAAHVLMAALITASGALQLVPQVRVRAMAFHRWNGRLYISTAFLMALGGLWLIWVRGTYLTLYGAASSTLLASLIMTCAAMTLRQALARQLDSHRRWALRTFMVVNGVWFQRLGYMAWLVINRGPVGIGKNMDGPFDIFWGFASYLLPLAVLELYQRTKHGAGPGGRLAMAGGLVGLTLLMGVGIVSTYLLMWRPLL